MACYTNAMDSDNALAPKRAGRPRALFALPPAGGPDFGYEVTPDGEHFIVNKEGTPTRFTRMNVVLNWFEELQRKVPTGK